MWPPQILPLCTLGMRDTGDQAGCPGLCAPAGEVAHFNCAPFILF